MWNKMEVDNLDYVFRIISIFFWKWVSWIKWKYFDL